MKLEYGVGVEITESFRWAMYTSPLGYGLNAQTSPKALRYFLEPPPGRIFAGGDLSQAEARVVAYDSCCKDLIEVFNDPTRSVHLENALAFFGHPVEKDTPLYTAAKAGVHGIHYKEGPYRLSVSIGFPVKQTRKLIEGYHQRRPEIRRWHDRIYDTIKSTGKLINPFGEARTFYEAISCFSITGKMTDQQWKDAIAWTAQSTVPHVLNLGLLEMKRLRDEGMDLLFHHQGHDSFLVSLPVGEEVPFFDAVSKFYAGVKLAGAGGIYSIPTEFTVGYNFGDMFNYTGETLPRSKWQALLDKKLAKKPREQQVLEGAYGIHLADWRPIV